jgi:hypothetical protein
MASAPARRILAVLAGSFAGYGARRQRERRANEHPVVAISGAAVYTGDVMTGFMIAGGGLGLEALPRPAFPEGQNLAELNLSGTVLAH